MAIIDHWHPAGKMSELRKRPTLVRIDNRDIVVFEASQGRFGALDEPCVHRRMSLSRGRVVDGRLECCYHGWRFDATGHGESPGSPKTHAQTRHYETSIEHGWVWIRETGASTHFPQFDTAGFVRIADLTYDFDLPFELVLDNFTEAEHTGPVHVHFGFPTERMHEVEVRVEAGDDFVSVVNYGPQKPLAWPYRLLVGIRRDDFLIDDWTTYFAPLHCVYNFRYEDPRTHRPGLLHQRAVFFFVPRGGSTRVVMFLYFKYNSWLADYLGFLFYPLVRRRFHDEVVRDQHLLRGLADLNPSLDGMKLSRFDRVLGLNRDRIAKYYRGGAGADIAHRNGICPVSASS